MTYTCRDSKYMPWLWLKKREIGQQISVNESRRFRGGIYSSLNAVHKWDPKKTVDSTHHGGIFNFDFSPDGSLLATACEGQSVLLFDPFNGKLIGERGKAHTDCVNCVRFLDSRLFATCSDDTTVALWDVRFLKNKLRDLHGHTNWVKNIEYDTNNGLLVTSGFDGNIFTWDINSYSETETKGNKVFTYKLLMRSKLFPDASKLVISTQNGYIIIIHDLDLLTLAEDLKGFPPYGSPSTWTALSMANKHKRNRVELIKDWPAGDNASDIASLQIHPQGWCVMSRNISRDKKSEWTCIHDLQEPVDNTNEEAAQSEGFSVMPHTSCCQSSSTYTPASSSIAPSTVVTSAPRTSTVGGTPLRAHLRPSIIINPSGSEDMPMGTLNAPSIVINPPTFSMEGHSDRNSGRTTDGASIETHGAPSVIINSSSGNNDEPSGNRRFSSSLTIHISNNGESSGSSSQTSRRVQRLDFPLEYSDNQSTSSRPTDGNSELRSGMRTMLDHRNEPRWSINPSNEQELESLLHDDLSSDSSDDSDLDLLPPTARRSVESDIDDLISMRNIERTQNYQDLVALVVRYDVFTGIIDVNHRVRLGNNSQNSSVSPNVKTKDRLLYFTEEPNVARGFIKELCFSSDGRLICSPFGYGVRMLAFDQNCSELCDVIPTQPMRLYEVGNCLSHSNIVVTCKFSPRHCMFVSGCLSGKVLFHQPVL